MKLINAIIQPTKLSTVREALREIGIDQVSILDAIGYGRQRGQKASFRGNEYRVDMLRKITLEVLVQDDDVERVIDAIGTNARTGSDGEIGDGKIFVLPAAEAIDLAPTSRL
ncbi:MAG: P-II family nitrogen regulator [Planctomycetota bacterium]